MSGKKERVSDAIILHKRMNFGNSNRNKEKKCIRVVRQQNKMAWQDARMYKWTCTVRSHLDIVYRLVCCTTSKIYENFLCKTDHSYNMQLKGPIQIHTQSTYITYENRKRRKNFLFERFKNLKIDLNTFIQPCIYKFECTHQKLCHSTFAKLKGEREMCKKWRRNCSRHTWIKCSSLFDKYHNVKSNIRQILLFAWNRNGKINRKNGKFNI